MTNPLDLTSSMSPQERAAFDAARAAGHQRALEALEGLELPDADLDVDAHLAALEAFLDEGRAD